MMTSSSTGWLRWSAHQLAQLLVGRDGQLENAQRWPAADMRTGKPPNKLVCVQHNLLVMILRRMLVSVRRKPLVLVRQRAQLLYANAQ